MSNHLTLDNVSRFTYLFLKITQTSFNLEFTRIALNDTNLVYH